MATVNGNAKDVNKNAFGGVIYVDHQTTPCADGTDFIVGGRRSIPCNITTGAFTCTLAAGRYKVTVNLQSRYFTVPTGSATYDLTALLDAPDAFTNILATIIGWLVFETIAALKADTALFANKPVTLLGELAAYDITPARTYIYSSTSTATSNDGSVIKPTSVSGAGRYLQIT